MPVQDCMIRTAPPADLTQRNRVGGAVEACTDSYKRQGNPSMSNSSRALISVDEARTLLIEATRPLTGAENVALAEALGRVLAQPAAAASAVPPFDNSAMDGYACASADLSGEQTRLPISDRIPAGHAPGALKPGTAARIMTGAVLPEGADMVVVQERCEADDEQVTIGAAADPGANIRRGGEELAPGQTALEAGHRLAPEDLGLLATIGLAEVAVRPRPRVAILSTGDELVEPGRPLSPGQIYNSNAVMLAGLAQVMGCDTQVLAHVADTAEATERALSRAVERADLVLTSGGVSVGDADWVRKTIERLGALELWKIAVKPGKPLAFGRIGQTPIIGLPGNPVASHVGFCLFVAPVLRTMLGCRSAFPEALRLPAGFETGPASREIYWRVRPVEGVLKAFSQQGSAALSSVSWAHGLARVPIDQPVRLGDPIDYFPFGSLLA